MYELQFVNISFFWQSLLNTGVYKFVCYYYYFYYYY